MAKSWNFNLNAKAAWRVVGFFAFTLIATWGAGQLLSRVSFNRGDSVDPWFLWLELKPTEIHRGEYVLFPLRYEHYRKGEEFNAVKRAVCLPGDQLEVAEGWALCNGNLLGTGKRPVGRPKFRFKGPIPAGHLFVMGDNERSWDSRYWGLLDQNLIIARSRASF